MEPQSFDCGHAVWSIRGVQVDEASMEPQSFDCGHAAISAATERAKGFNGAAVFRLRTPEKRCEPYVRQSTLQWSRSLSTADTLSAMVSQPCLGGASMEPQSFDCGHRDDFVMRVS